MINQLLHPVKRKKHKDIKYDLKKRMKRDDKVKYEKETMWYDCDNIPPKEDTKG